VLSEFKTRAEGLTEEEAERRLEEYGPNVVADEARFTRLKLLVKACLNPLVVLLSLSAAWRAQSPKHCGCTPNHGLEFRGGRIGARLLE